ncbi:MAG: diacylglycerol kinase family protein [Cyanosarcina radialis HA8281-LM2]|jgi:diacylglycerol kinase (ATP)|nr:diacylglycerol kinase family protein [Cyanosarcina radialis HA8281-LM2]
MTINLNTSLISVSQEPEIDISKELSMLTSEISEAVLKPDRKFAWKTATNLFKSFKYAWAGVSYAFITQRNFRIHTFVGTLAISLSLWFRLKPVEIVAIVLTAGLVLVMELLNTAIESVVDLTVKQSYHELAKIAKDCAAGAVLVSALASLLVAGSLLLPPILSSLQTILK